MDGNKALALGLILNFSLKNRDKQMLTQWINQVTSVCMYIFNTYLGVYVTHLKGTC